jgi:glycerol-3-phosphate dehydrogenase (NAD(P)+)
MRTYADKISFTLMQRRAASTEVTHARRAAVLGAGAWGTALAAALARSGFAVQLWARRTEHASAMRAERENSARLPGCPFPDLLTPTSSLADALEGADVVLLAGPSGSAEELAHAARPHVRGGVPAVLCAKGLAKDGTLLSDRVAAHWQGNSVLVLSGPSFADEVASDLPTIVTLAGPMALAAPLAARMSAGKFVLSPTDDITGVQIAGVFKNVVATLCGTADGLGRGANARAALMSEGMREAATLLPKLGGKVETLLGPAGFGDFALTCTDAKSRNYSFGFRLAREGAQAGAGSTREGAANVDALIRLAERANVDVPLAAAVADLVKGKIDAASAIDAAFDWRRNHATELARAV